MSQFTIQFTKSTLLPQEIIAATSDIKLLLAHKSFHKSVYTTIWPGFRTALEADPEVSQHVASNLDIFNDADCEDFLSMVLKTQRPGCKKPHTSGFELKSEFEFNPLYVLSIVSKHNKVFSYFMRNGTKILEVELYSELTQFEFDVLLESGLMTEALNDKLIDIICEKMPAKSISLLIRNIGKTLAYRHDYTKRVSHITNMIKARSEFTDAKTNLVNSLIAEVNATASLAPKTFVI